MGGWEVPTVTRIHPRFIVLVQDQMRIENLLFNVFLWWVSVNNEFRCNYLINLTKRLHESNCYSQSGRRVSDLPNLSVPSRARTRLTRLMHLSKIWRFETPFASEKLEFNHRSNNQQCITITKARLYQNEIKCETSATPSELTNLPIKPKMKIASWLSPLLSFLVWL